MLFCSDGIENISKALPSYCSIFQAEATAISEAALKPYNTGATNLKIQIYSDSQAVIMALTKPYTKSKTILRCHNNLNKLCSKNHVTLSWVAGHQGYEGNETADQLAKNGKDQPLTGPNNIK